MNEFNGIPIDKGGLVTVIVVNVILALVIAVALFGVLLDFKKRIDIYRKVCKKEPSVNMDGNKSEKKLRKLNRRKQESKKKAMARVLADAGAVLVIGLLLSGVIASAVVPAADAIMEDYCDVVSEYEIVTRRVRRTREYVILEDGTTLEYDAMVGKESGETGKGRFIYGKRSGIIVGFKEIE